MSATVVYKCDRCHQEMLGEQRRSLRLVDPTRFDTEAYALAVEFEVDLCPKCVAEVRVWKVPK